MHQVRTLRGRRQLLRHRRHHSSRRLLQVWRQVAPGTEVHMPAGAAANPHAGLSSVSCPAKGSCAVVGYYQTATTGTGSVTLSVAAGKPTAAQPLTVLPSDAAPAPTPSLFSVTCPAAGTCVAVGGYKTMAGSIEPMIITQSGGQWTSATGIDLPMDAFAVGQDA